MEDAAVPVEAYGQGLALLRQGRHEEAIPLLEQVVQEQPEHLEAQVALARSLLGVGRYSDAENLCRRLAKRFPKDLQVLELWVQALGAVDEPKKAAKACRRILDMRPEKEKAIAQFAQFECDAGRTKKAIGFLEKHVRRHGATPVALAAIGECCLRQGRIEKAESCFQRSLDLNPDYGPARRGLESLGRSDVVAEAESAAVTDGMLGAASLGEIEGWLDEGSILRATRALEERVRRGDKDPQVRLLLARCYERSGQSEEAIRIGEELVEERLNEPILHYLLGALYRRKGDTSEAIESLALAAELSPEHIETFCELALALRESGKLQQAEAAFRRALHLTARKFQREGKRVS